MIQIISLKRELSRKLLVNLCSVVNPLRKRYFSSQHKNFYDFVVEECYACNTCTKVKIFRGKNRFRRKDIGKVFLSDYTGADFSLPKAKCFDLIFDESDLLCDVLEKKSFLTFNSQNLIYSFAIKEDDFSGNC
jgi:hypothetical protein